MLGFRKTVRGVLENQRVLLQKKSGRLFRSLFAVLQNICFSRDLDTVSVAEYAQKHHVKRRAQRLILEPLSTGIFFLPPENYSAHAFFGLLLPQFPNFIKCGLELFRRDDRGTVTNPVVREATKAGCRFQFGASFRK